MWSSAWQDPTSFLSESFSILGWLAGSAVFLLIAAWRGYHWKQMFWWAFFTTWIGAILIFLMLEENPARYMEVCPACQYLIPRGALRCPHCTTIQEHNLPPSEE